MEVCLKEPPQVLGAPPSGGARRPSPSSAPYRRYVRAHDWTARAPTAVVLVGAGRSFVAHPANGHRGRRYRAGSHGSRVPMLLSLLPFRWSQVTRNLRRARPGARRRASASSVRAARVNPPPAPRSSRPALRKHRSRRSSTGHARRGGGLSGPMRRPRHRSTRPAQRHPTGPGRADQVGGLLRGRPVSDHGTLLRPGVLDGERRAGRGPLGGRSAALGDAPRSGRPRRRPPTAGKRCRGLRWTRAGAGRPPGAAARRRDPRGGRPRSRRRSRDSPSACRRSTSPRSVGSE